MAASHKGDLLGGHNDIDGLEVVTQVVPHKDAAGVHQEAQLQVGLLHGCQVVWGHLGIQITWHLHCTCRALTLRQSTTDA